jgi:hypothetical protein
MRISAFSGAPPVSVFAPLLSSSVQTHGANRHLCRVLVWTSIETPFVNKVRLSNRLCVLGVVQLDPCPRLLSCLII